MPKPKTSLAAREKRTPTPRPAKAVAPKPRKAESPPKRAPRDVDAYIAGFPKEVQAILEQIRATIRKAAPKANESITYQIPTYKLNGERLIYFAAFKNHVSVYPKPREAERLQDELAKYEGGKGTVQFPLDKPVPYGLITRIVKYRLANIKEKS